MINKICHLIASREHGGLEKHVADLSRWQAHNTNARVSVIAHPRYLSTLDEKVQFIPLNTDCSRHHPNLVWRLASCIRTGGYQIAHGHGSKSAQLLAAVKPYTESLQVITRHNVRHPRDKLASFFDARIAISEKTVANSRLDWDIIPSGVELREPNRLPRDTEQIRGKEKKLLIPGRLFRARGIDTLLEALTMLPDVHLLALGDGPDKAALQERAKTLGIYDRVAFCGPQWTLAEYLQVADLVIIPARGEGPPYALIESLLHRRPVLSMSPENTTDYLPANYILDTPQPRAMAEKIAMLLINPQQTARDFLPLYEHARRELTLDTMGRATWHLYTRLFAKIGAQLRVPHR